MQEVCMPTDPSAAMIQASGSYIFHLAFAIIIKVWVVRTQNFACFKQAEVWLGMEDPDSWVETFSSDDPDESFLNTICDKLFWMHIICFVMLFASQFYYFKSLNDCKLSGQSLMQLLTIPVYVIILYEAEYTLRKFRPDYDDKATVESFKLMTPELNTVEGGDICTAEKQGNAQ
jgi:hypothetical protein